MTGCRQICVSWKVDLNIFGWQLSLLPGVYPPGPPPGLIFPPGITLPRPLPPWPEITIGEDNVPTYTEEPTSCKTESATMFFTTTSFGVPADSTTATQVLSTSGVLLGCNVQNQSSTMTTTSACPTTPTTCTGIVVIMTAEASNPLIAEILDSNNALAAEVNDYVSSIWSGYSEKGTEEQYWARTFDWTPLRRLNDIPVGLALEVAPKLGNLKEVQFTAEYWDNATFLEILPTTLKSEHSELA
ncbi:hypothetical protein DL95DRAFT_462485 [Leptodontidium sp. 2 PMI_412]|nr:hypothetical protein DL95DRAFT_462485 [Leptodontidium sp. 2 PMI_412]